MTAELRHLWQEAFGDSEEMLDGFAATGFSPNRFHCICEKEIPVSALYWFDCQLDGYKLAYIYAVATLKSHQGQGLAKQLMTETHEILKEKGYDGAILVPASGLFPFYEKLGYQAVTSVSDYFYMAADKPVTLQEIDTAEYARLRKALLPAGGVVQEGAALAYLHTYTKFYAGEDFLLSVSPDRIQEFLGDISLAPGILAGLGMAAGRFRVPGGGRDFAMYLPFREDCPQPRYFGLALD